MSKGLAKAQDYKVTSVKAIEVKIPVAELIKVGVLDDATLREHLDLHLIIFLAIEPVAFSNYNTPLNAKYAT